MTNGIECPIPQSAYATGTAASLVSLDSGEQP